MSSMPSGMMCDAMSAVTELMVSLVVSGDGMPSGMMCNAINAVTEFMVSPVVMACLVV